MKPAQGMDFLQLC